uniref:Uncharacterized protein n=2 Tax=viral metagenome TaxID=1070528 RepID=A0A6M3KMX3_9ZZZZ
MKEILEKWKEYREWSEKDWQERQARCSEGVIAIYDHVSFEGFMDYLTKEL